MLKVVVFDSGYGGELFADQLEEALPVVEVIRVIDWRNAEKIQSSSRGARQCAREALRPYIGKVDLIIFANYLLSITSLKYFQRKFKNQQFLGLSLKKPETFIQREIVILTTKPVAKTINYYNFLFHLKQKARTLLLDSWTGKIDDGELTETEISQTIHNFLKKDDLKLKEVILACAHFNDIKTELKHSFGHNLKINDSFNDTIIKTCKILKIRGGVGKKN